MIQIKNAKGEIMDKDGMYIGFENVRTNIFDTGRDVEDYTPNNQYTITDTRIEKLLEYVKNKIKNLEENPPYTDYQGEYNAKILEEKHEAKIDILKDVLDDIEKIIKEVK